MNNKGQMEVAALIILFISILVGLVLFLPIAQNVGSVTDTQVFNTTESGTVFTAPASGASTDLTGQELIGDAVVQNGSDGTAIETAGNWTVTEIVSTTTGVKTLSFTTTAGSEFASKSVNLTYTYGPDGYIESAGARSITGLIVLFFALGIAVVAMTPVMRSKLFDLVGK